MVVVAGAQCDGYGSGGHFRGAVSDPSLQVAPVCTLHRMMSILPCKTAPCEGFKVRHWQLGVGGVKGYITDTTSAKEFLPKWFTCTTTSATLIAHPPTH